MKNKLSNVFVIMAIVVACMVAYVPYSLGIWRLQYIVVISLPYLAIYHYGVNKGISAILYSMWIGITSIVSVLSLLGVINMYYIEQDKYIVGVMQIHIVMFSMLLWFVTVALRWTYKSIKVKDKHSISKGQVYLIATLVQMLFGILILLVTDRFTYLEFVPMIACILSGILLYSGLVLGVMEINNKSK